MVDTLNDDMRRAQRAWLQQLEQQTGRKLSALAKDAKVASSTLYKLANQPDYPYGLSNKTIAKLSRLTGIQPPPGATGGSLGGHVLEFAEPEAEPYVFDGEPGFDAWLRSFIGGRVGVDPWILHTRALELAGYLPGDVVVVDMNARPRDGDIVCAQVYDFDRARAETVWRIYETPYLLAASTDRDLMRPIRADVDGAAQVKGVVLGLFRQRAAA